MAIQHLGTSAKKYMAFGFAHLNDVIKVGPEVRPPRLERVEDCFVEALLQQRRAVTAPDETPEILRTLSLVAAPQNNYHSITIIIILIIYLYNILYLLL